MKKRDTILTQADICDAREALHTPHKAAVIYLTPGEFKSLCAAFEKMENEIKELRRELQWERLDNKFYSETMKDLAEIAGIQRRALIYAAHDEHRLDSSPEASYRRWYDMAKDAKDA